MTTLSASPFIVDSIWQRTRTSALMQITSLTALTVLSAQIVIPLPFTPIPLTMQTFARYLLMVRDNLTIQRGGSLFRNSVLTRQSCRRM